MELTDAEIATLRTAYLDALQGKVIHSVTVSGDTTTFADGATPQQLFDIITQAEAASSSTFSWRTKAKNGGRG